MSDAPSITCPACGMTSYNINDIHFKYCDNCGQFHADMADPQITEWYRCGMNENELMLKYPSIPWREPLPITRCAEQDKPQAGGLACRLCIAMAGLKAEDIHLLPQTEEQFQKHLTEHHGQKTEAN